MQGADRTTRQRIADVLREETTTATALAAEVDVTTAQALDHVEHVARSLDGTGEQLLAAPPECNYCGFADFDDVANRPSRCPECRSEDVAGPAFRID